MDYDNFMKLLRTRRTINTLPRRLGTRPGASGEVWSCRRDCPAAYDSGHGSAD